MFYRLAAGTAIRMRIVKMSEPDAKGGFEGLIQDVHLVNPSGRRIPNIPHLSSLFLGWENEVELLDEDDAITQSFIVPERDGLSTIATASNTFIRILHASAALRRRRPNLQAVVHNLSHWVHEPQGFDIFLREASRHGVVDNVMHQRPRTVPRFLKTSKPRPRKRIPR